MKKIVAIHQPNFLPWIGFFDKITQVDLFILLGDVQYEKNSTINRNKIKTPQGEFWLTIPVKAHLDQKINQVVIDESVNWRKNHLKTIFVNYKKSQNFEKIYPLIEKIYLSNNPSLVEFNLEFIKMVCGILKIKTKIVLASTIQASGKKNELLINLIKISKGTHYLSGLGSKNYLNEELFTENGIEVIWQNFVHPKYKQIGKDFIPNLSVLDFIFCSDSLDIFQNKLID